MSILKNLTLGRNINQEFKNRKSYRYLNVITMNNTRRIYSKITQGNFYLISAFKAFS